MVNERELKELEKLQEKILQNRNNDVISIEIKYQNRRFNDIFTAKINLTKNEGYYAMTELNSAIKNKVNQIINESYFSE